MAFIRKRASTTSATGMALSSARVAITVASSHPHKPRTYILDRDTAAARHSTMRSLIACLFLMLLAVSANAADEWIRFADPVGNFTVEFQRQPRAMTAVGTSPMGENVPISTYTVQNGASVMMVVDAPVINRTLPFFEIVERAAKSILAAAASRNEIVQSDMPDLLDGQVGRSFSILQTDGSLETLRMFYVNGHLYRLVTITEGGNRARTADALRFSETLHLTAQQQQ
jgi:hypothetical protein